MKMGEKFEQSRESESSKSSKYETVSYNPQKLSFRKFRKQERQDKKDADAILSGITWENAQKWNSRENHSQPRIRINSDTLRNMPRWKIDDDTLWFVQNTVDRYNIQRREDEYLAQHEKLSENEYNRLFSGKEKLQQWQFWDCYLVSWINELANAQHFDTLMRTSIQRMKRSNWDIWYQIQIPLWEPSWRKILIKNPELGVAKIRWNDWYKLLEIAYAKNRRPNNKIWNRYSPITHEEFEKIRWWWMKEVFETFLWKNNISFNTFWDQTRRNPLKSISQNNKEQIVWFLKNYTPQTWRKFVSLSSIWWESDTKQYTVGWKTMYHKHAYSLTWINKDSKWNIKSLKVLNPWNDWRQGWKYLDLTLDEFFQAFSYMSCGTINMQTFLDNKSMS